MKFLFLLVMPIFIMILSSSYGGEGEHNNEWWDDLKKRGKGCVVLKINHQNRYKYYLVAGTNRRMPLSFAIKHSMNYSSMKTLLADFDKRIGKRNLLRIGSEEIVVDDLEAAEILKLNKRDLEWMQR